jgi:diguanylate cyclase (GGDEF)-like protein
LVAQPALASIQIASRAMPTGQQHDLLMMFFVTAMLFPLLWAILNYILDRVPEVGLLAIHQAVYTLFGIVAGGYLALFFPSRIPQLADWAHAIFYFAINFTAVLFCRELFRLYDPHPVSMHGLNVLLGASPVLVVVFAIGYRSFAINANAVLIQISWLALAVTAIALREEDYPRRWIIRAFFVAIWASNAAFWIAGRFGGTAPAFDLREIQLLVVNGLAVSGFFVVILKARALHAQRIANQSFLDLMRIQKQFNVERELKRQAELQAQTDYLTGVLNRRRFVETGEGELARAMRYQRPLSLLMFDIDHFKSVNDTWGHAIGDFVLQEVAHLIRDALRNADIFGRTGGEEFAAILVETEGNAAASVAQRLCATVAEAAITAPGAGRIPVTVSIGLAPLNRRSISFDELLNEADHAMYVAKEAGRNQVSVSV